jgi:DNA-binding NarL/FixJ family response regulator
MSDGPPGAGLPVPFGRVALSADFPSPRFTTRVAIFHGNRMTAELLHAYCVMSWGCQVVAMEWSADFTHEVILRAQPDVILVGHTAHSLSCFTVLAQLRATNVSAKIIAVIPELSDYLVHKLNLANFNGVVEEASEGIAPVQTAIEQVRAGGRFLSPKYVQIAGRLRADPDSFPKLLTGRQEEVLVCIAHAMDDHEIARTLHMSPSTAQRHRADILRKLGLRSTPRLIRFGGTAGFNSVPVPRTAQATRHA